MLTLFKTLLEIIFLQKGPESLPRSSVLFVMVAGLWFVVGAIGAAIVDSYDGQALIMDLVLTAVGFLLYAIVLRVFDRNERLLQALTAILGCGAIFGAALFAGRFVLAQILSVSDTAMYSEIILLWSILIEGHIIARTIERLWFFGILVALAVFIIQLQVFAYFKPVLVAAV